MVEYRCQGPKHEAAMSGELIFRRNLLRVPIAKHGFAAAFSHH